MIYNNDGWTGRQAGTVIEVKAVYNNMYKLLSTFGYWAIEYTYEVSELPMPYVNRVSLTREQPAEQFPQKRRYQVAHGVLVWFKVGGQFGFFNIVYLRLMLTTAFALVAGATSMTDLLAVYLHPRRKNSGGASNGRAAVPAEVIQLKSKWPAYPGIRGTGIVRDLVVGG